jgi:hypothetical protein
MTRVPCTVHPTYGCLSGTTSSTPHSLKYRHYSSHFTWLAAFSLIQLSLTVRALILIVFSWDFPQTQYQCQWVDRLKTRLGTLAQLSLHAATRMDGYR